MRLEEEAYVMVARQATKRPTPWATTTTRVWGGTSAGGACFHAPAPSTVCASTSRSAASVSLQSTASTLRARPRTISARSLSFTSGPSLIPLFVFCL